ncbi:transaldolase family protein [Thermophilibacter immobilis]|jgi:TalC/MipB family fructose-6-phosphate aldolase|uniref:Fructose-6-phosphate aldolase n=1 Tax=Thermophilibacter immobilis TaxID=2779519 RepID=A0A7S7RUD7_9ACTN|nr:transaldolase family protein [Thermophilibacter immobilis]QOY60154.1 hypothetical protein INP52_06965 [Thermophilibacter immobilis]
MLEFCLDTGDLDMVRKASKIYPLNCYSMNPSIAVRCLKGTGKSFIQNALDIREVIGEDVPFFLEAMGDTAEEMVEDAQAMVKAVPGNTLVKIAACPEGFKAIRMLCELEIPTSCTAIYTFNQAMLAAMAGASYVAVYVSRLDKNGGNGIDVVRRIKQAFLGHDISCVVSAASLKTPLALQEAIEAGADNVTVDLDMLDALAVHPMTQKTLETFKSDWEGLFGKGIRIANMVD